MVRTCVVLTIFFYLDGGFVLLTLHLADDGLFRAKVPAVFPRREKDAPTVFLILLAALYIVFRVAKLIVIKTVTGRKSRNKVKFMPSLHVSYKMVRRSVFKKTPPICLGGRGLFTFMWNDYGVYVELI